MNPAHLSVWRWVGGELLYGFVNPEGLGTANYSGYLFQFIFNVFQSYSLKYFSKKTSCPWLGATHNNSRFGKH